MVSILESIRLAEARSCHPDDYRNMVNARHVAKKMQQNQRFRAVLKIDEDTTAAATEDDTLSVVSASTNHSVKSSSSTSLSAVRAPQQQQQVQPARTHEIALVTTNTATKAQPQVTGSASPAVAIFLEQPEELLESIRQALQEHKDRQAEAQASIQVHETKAQARYEMGNNKGALLSLKRAARLRAEEAHFAELRVIPQLEMLQTDVEIPSEGAASDPRYFTALQGEVERVLALHATEYERLQNGGAGGDDEETDTTIRLVVPSDDELLRELTGSSAQEEETAVDSSNRESSITDFGDEAKPQQQQPRDQPQLQQQKETATMSKRKLICSLLVLDFCAVQRRRSSIQTSSSNV